MARFWFRLPIYLIVGGPLVFLFTWLAGASLRIGFARETVAGSTADTAGRDGRSREQRTADRLRPARGGGCAVDIAAVVHREGRHRDARVRRLGRVPD